MKTTVYKNFSRNSKLYTRKWEKNRQFRNFEEELELEDAPSDVSLYCVVRWLSTSNVMSRFVDLLQPINLFLDGKKKCYPQLKNNARIQGLVFLTDYRVEIKHSFVCCKKPFILQRKLEQSKR